MNLADTQWWTEHVVVTSKPWSFIHKHTYPETSDGLWSTMSGSILLRHHPLEEDKQLQEEEEMEEELFVEEELEEEVLMGITEDKIDLEMEEGKPGER